MNTSVNPVSVQNSLPSVALHTDEVIKFWKVKGQGPWGGMRSTERPSS